MHDTKVSIIIAARNEEKYIEKCLHSILANDYPKELIEIIVVDDQSSDHTVELVTSISDEILLLQTDQSKIGKKSALRIASQKASGELLIFTDADSVVPLGWIKTLVSNFVNNDAVFLAAPIQIDLEDHWLSRLQYLDVSATIAVGANGIYREKYYTANGANMAVDRMSYLELNEARSDMQIASGDDMFTVQYLAKEDSSKIKFINNADCVVTTIGEQTVRSFLAQRKRWASKSFLYPENGIIYIQGFVFSYVSLILFNVIFGLATNGFGVFIALFMLFIKAIIDYLFLNKLAEHYKKSEAMKWYLFSVLAYNVYILYAGFSALFPSKYVWKGRKVS